MVLRKIISISLNRQRRCSYLSDFLILFFIFCGLISFSFPVSWNAAYHGAYFAEAAGGNGAHVEVEASWKETPLLQEALEWAARGGAGERISVTSPLGFSHSQSSSLGSNMNYRAMDGFLLLETLWEAAQKKKPQPLDSWTQAEQYSLLQEVVPRFLSHSISAEIVQPSHGEKENTGNPVLSESAKAKLARLEVELAVRVYSPAVEAHYAIVAAAISSLRPALPWESDVSKTSFSCADTDPFVLLYAPMRSAPSRLTSIQELLDAKENFFTSPEAETTTPNTSDSSSSNSKSSEKARDIPVKGKEPWRRELWLGDDVSGVSFLHLFPGSPRLHNADAVIVLFGTPVDMKTISWYRAIKRWVESITVELSTRKTEGKDSLPSSPLKARFLFGHLPLSAERRCHVVFQSSERKRRILSLQNWDSKGKLGLFSENPTSWWELPLYVQGYGVKVSLPSLPWNKESELNFEKDRSRKASKVKDVVKGFNISKISSRYPSLSKMVNSFAEELESTDFSTPLSLEADGQFLDHLGFGMLQYLSTRLQAEVEKLQGPTGKNGIDQKDVERRHLQILCDVSSNLPSYVPQFASLASLHFDPSAPLQKELDLLASRFPDGKSVVYLNKNLVSKGRDSIFGLLESMKEFELQQDRLEELFTTRFLIRDAENHIEGAYNSMEYDPHYMVTAPIINASMTQQVMKETYSNIKERLRLFMRSSLSSLPYGLTVTNSAFGNIPSRIHIDASIVFWVNDVETDPRFKHLPTPIGPLGLIPTGLKSSMQFPRQNMFNLVIIVDPTTESGVTGLKDLLRILKTGIPVRAGLVLVLDSWGAVNSKDRDDSEEALASLLLQERDILITKIEDYGDTPYDLEELDDNEARRLLHGDTRLGAYAIILETLLRIQGRLFLSDGSMGEQESSRGEKFIESLERIIDFFKELDEESKKGEGIRATSEVKRYNREKAMLVQLKRFLDLSDELSPEWSDEESSDTLVNYYLRLRNGMGSFYYPSFPAVLLNGVLLTQEKSIMSHVDSEAAALQKALRDTHIFSPDSPKEETLSVIMRLFHASKRRHRGLDEALPLALWHGRSRTLSWVPSLLAFYEQSIFLSGGLERAAKKTKLPKSAVSGVFLFPRRPTLRTLDLLEKSLIAANGIGTSFRLTFLSSLDCDYQGPLKRIEKLLHLLLTYEYPGSNELRFPLLDTSWSTSGGEASAVEGSQEKAKRALAVLKRVNAEKSRFNAVHLFLKLVLRLANKLNLPFDSTFLSDFSLWNSLVIEAKIRKEVDEENAFTYIFPMILEMEEKKLGDRKWSSPTSDRLHQTSHLCQIFKEFITQQAVPQGELGRALGLEPSLKELITVESPSPIPSSFPLLFVLHGKVIPLNTSFTEEDLAEAVYRVTPLAEAVFQSLERVPFANVSGPIRSPFLSPGAPLPLFSVLAKDSTQLDRMIGVTSEFLSARTALLSAFLTQSGHGISEMLSGVDTLPVFPSNSTVIHRFTSPLEAPVRHSLALVVDPTREDGARLLMLAKYFLSSSIAVDLTIYLNPSTKGAPIPTFFKFVGSPRITFDSQTGQVQPPAVVMSELPKDTPLSLAIQEGPLWNVFPSRSPDYDLDNFVLSSHSNDASLFSVTYKLQSLVMSGMVQAPHPRDQPSVSQNYKPLVTPTGLPLSFTACFSEMPWAVTPTVKNDVREAFVISASQGYFQSSLIPGLWTLSVHGSLAERFYLSEIGERSTGKEKEWWINFDDSKARNPLESHGKDQRIPIMIDSFHLSPTQLTYDRSWDHRSNLESIQKQEYLQKNMEVKKTTPRSPLDRTPTLHIFTVASGQMYEQFLRAMMLSVHQVSALSEEADVDLGGRLLKFWLLENFLSPKFKKAVTKMADFYGFEVGFVTYHWPEWLEEPTDRLMKLWAYKVLFLDVLFPLEVDRILYLDADEISLADLHELYKLDFTSGGVRRMAKDAAKKETAHGLRQKIEEAPTIAMPPFCSGQNRNVKTKHLRYWEVKGKFWKSYLDTLSFHSSSLFLVDLLRFRTQGHGNIYRDTFNYVINNARNQVGSDQDFVNILQREVPIYTLQEEWLWCETWCSSASKKNAKVIDACVNPLLKMSKIDTARYVHSNWDSIQKELDDLFESLENGTLSPNKTVIRENLSSSNDLRETINDDL